MQNRDRDSRLSPSPPSWNLSDLQGANGCFLKILWCTVLPPSFGPCQNPDFKPLGFNFLSPSIFFPPFLLYFLWHKMIRYWSSNATYFGPSALDFKYVVNLNILSVPMFSEVGHSLWVKMFLSTALENTNLATVAKYNKGFWRASHLNHIERKCGNFTPIWYIPFNTLTTHLQNFAALLFPPLVGVGWGEQAVSA